VDDLITVTEAADQANVAASTVYRWIQGGVLSLRYFNDGRQAIVVDELERLLKNGENAALVQLFHTVGHALDQAVALLPAVEHVFGPGWQDHAFSTAEWERIRVMAYKQAEAHRDVGPLLPRRGRPARSTIQRNSDLRGH
jgi:excisionase family DNA binding protein